MLKIRLSRTGKKKQPSFRIIVQEKSAAVKSGKVVENLGYYLPTANPKVLNVDLDRAKYWIENGAQPSDSVAVLLKNEGVSGLEKFIAPRNKKAKKKKAVEEEPAAPAPAAPAEEPKEEAPKEEAPAEEKAPEPKAEEAPAEEKKEEASE